jgi:hypothetical protein
MKITVYCDYLPIPIRSMDWQAFDEDRIDGAPDAGIQAQRVGYGRTRDEALQELAEIACDDYTDGELTQGDEAALQRCDATTMVFVALVRNVGVAT